MSRVPLFSILPAVAPAEPANSKVPAEMVVPVVLRLVPVSLSVPPLIV